MTARTFSSDTPSCSWHTRLADANGPFGVSTRRQVSRLPIELKGAAQCCHVCGKIQQAESNDQHTNSSRLMAGNKQRLNTGTLPSAQPYCTRSRFFAGVSEKIFCNQPASLASCTKNGFCQACVAAACLLSAATHGA